MQTGSLVQGGAKRAKSLLLTDSSWRKAMYDQASAPSVILTRVHVGLLTRVVQKVILAARWPPFTQLAVSTVGSPTRMAPSAVLETKAFTSNCTQLKSSKTFATTLTFSVISKSVAQPSVNSMKLSPSALAVDM